MVLQLWLYDDEQSENGVQYPSQILEPEPDTGPNALYIPSNPNVSQEHVGRMYACRLPTGLTPAECQVPGKGKRRVKKERKIQNRPD